MDVSPSAAKPIAPKRKEPAPRNLQSGRGKRRKQVISKKK
jgi:hypothetical protein